jgi:hypothetical protein
VRSRCRGSVWGRKTSSRSTGSSPWAEGVFDTVSADGAVMVSSEGER